jgi:hypothetical protein
MIEIFGMIVLVLLAFVFGVLMKDWLLDKFSLYEAYIDQRVREFAEAGISNHSKHEAELEKVRAQAEVRMLDYVSKYLDDELLDSIEKKLIPRLSEREETVRLIEEKLIQTQEARDTAQQQVREAYKKLEFHLKDLQETREMLDNANMKLDFAIQARKNDRVHFTKVTESLTKEIADLTVRYHTKVKVASPMAKRMRKFHD